MDSTGEFDIIFGKCLHGRKRCASPLKNVEKQADALLNLLVRVDFDFIIVIVDKSGGQARFQLTPSGLA